MLSFIPMIDTASVYALDRDNLDAWGQATNKLVYTGKCKISYNVDLFNISQFDGQDARPSSNVLFHGMVKCRVGDRVEFTDELGEVWNVPIEDRYYMRDWGGKIVATRLIFANGLRD